MSEWSPLQDDLSRENLGVVNGVVENQKNPEQRGRYRNVVLGGTAVVLVGGMAGWGTGAFDGAAKAMSEMNPVKQEITTDGGEHEIIKQDLGFVETCWTATIQRVTGASAKLDVNADAPIIGEKSIGWKETTIDTGLERNLCIDPGEIHSTFNPNTEQLLLRIDDKDSIRTETEIIPGTHQAHTDQSPSFAAIENSINFLESMPVIEDSGLAKNMAKLDDKQSNMLRNIATINAMYDNACEQEIWDTTKEAVEYGIENVVFRGLQYDHPDMTREDVTVLIEGTEINELEVAGETSSIDRVWKKMQKLDQQNDNLSINSGEKGTCVVPPETKNPASVFNASGISGGGS